MWDMLIIIDAAIDASICNDSESVHAFLLLLQTKIKEVCNADAQERFLPPTASPRRSDVS